MQEIPHQDKWHFTGADRSKTLTMKLISLVMQVSHALHQLDVLYELNLGRLSPITCEEDWPQIEQSAICRIMQEDPNLLEHIKRQDGTLVPRPQGSQQIVLYNPASDNTVVTDTLAQLSQQSAGVTPQQVSVTAEQSAIAPELLPASESSAQMAIGWSSRADALGLP